MWGNQPGHQQDPRNERQYKRLPIIIPFNELKMPVRNGSRDPLPSSIKARNVDLIQILPTNLSALVSSISLAAGEAVHNQILVTNNVGGKMFMLPERAQFENTETINQLIPQYVSGADVGVNEANYQVIGPYNAILAKTETSPIAINKMANQLYIRNNSGGTVTIILWARVRFLSASGD